MSTEGRKPKMKLSGGKGGGRFELGKQLGW